MANADYTYDNIISTGTGSFKKESGFSASVRRMQTKLNRLGYNCGTPDGYFGSNTETQVKAFQSANNLTADGKAGASTLSKLDQLSPDSTIEKYGRELTHAQLTSGYSSYDMTATEAVARCIFGEDSLYSAGQAAVAKELYNRLHSPRTYFDTLSTYYKTWKGIVFSPNQYTVMTGTSPTSTANSRKPNQYSAEWSNCVSLAETLIRGNMPSSTLANQCYHLSSNSSYPSNSVVSTRIQIPANTGNKFYDFQTNL